jgi:hypothetical protein
MDHIPIRLKAQMELLEGAPLPHVATDYADDAPPFPPSGQQSTEATYSNGEPRDLCLQDRPDKPLRLPKATRPPKIQPQDRSLPTNVV